MSPVNLLSTLVKTACILLHMVAKWRCIKLCAFFCTTLYNRQCSITAQVDNCNNT